MRQTLENVLNKSFFKEMFCVENIFDKTFYVESNIALIMNGVLEELSLVSKMVYVIAIEVALLICSRMGFHFVIEVCLDTFQGTTLVFLFFSFPFFFFFCLKRKKRKTNVVS